MAISLTRARGLYAIQRHTRGNAWIEYCAAESQDLKTGRYAGVRGSNPFGPVYNKIMIVYFYSKAYLLFFDFQHSFFWMIEQWASRTFTGIFKKIISLYSMNTFSSAFFILDSSKEPSFDKYCTTSSHNSSEN